MWYALDSAAAVSPWLTEREQHDHPGTVSESFEMPLRRKLKDSLIPEMCAEGDGTSYQTPGEHVLAEAALADDLWTTFQNLLLGAACSSRV